MDYRKLILTCLTLAVLCISSHAQEFRNIRTTLRGDQVDLTFDLVGQAGRTYEIRVYGSHDGYATPLQFVTGDVGEGIIPGEGKAVVWNAHLEMGNFTGDVFLQLKGTTEPPFVSISNPTGGKLVKGKEVEITWDGDGEGRIRIELQRAGTSVARLGDVSNNGSFGWTVPKEIDNAKDYRLLFSNLSNSNEFIGTEPFSIGNQFGMGAKIGAGGVVVATVLYFILRTKPEQPIPLPREPN